MMMHYNGAMQTLNGMPDWPDVFSVAFGERDIMLQVPLVWRVERWLKNRAERRGYIVLVYKQQRERSQVLRFKRKSPTSFD